MSGGLSQQRAQRPVACGLCRLRTQRTAMPQGNRAATAKAAAAAAFTASHLNLRASLSLIVHL
uniref:Uncharacterized protein n=1 Tax=Oryza sativa subsp. japonica TaxID=39947 RepID=Q6Z7T6_ORYSJ|nr:hypothetical protein [Oryza sativa Japonica Group]